MKQTVGNVRVLWNTFRPKSCLLSDSQVAMIERLTYGPLGERDQQLKLCSHQKVYSVAFVARVTCYMMLSGWTPLEDMDMIASLPPTAFQYEGSKLVGVGKFLRDYTQVIVDMKFRDESERK